MIYRLALVLWLGALPAASAAQVTGTVAGEAPMSGAEVQLLDEASGTVLFVTFTDVDGRFRIGGTLPGLYLMEVSFLGYAPYRERIDVPEGGITLDIRLTERALVSPAVVITSERAREQLTPITYSNVSARDLELLPGMKDLPPNLRLSPSVTYYSESGHDMGYTYMRLRGFEQRRIAVTVNGVPQNDPEEHNVFWINFFDLQGSIQDIQLQRGAGSAFYGSSGIGGAINVVARPYKPDPYASAEFGYGSYNTRRLTFEGNTGLLRGNTVAFVRGSHLTSDGYRNWSWSRFWRLFAGIIRYGKRHTITLQAYGGPQEDGLAYVGIPKAANLQPVTDTWGTMIDRRYNFSEATRDQEWFHQPHAELIHEWQPGPRTEFRQTFFWIQGVGHFDFGGTFRSADYLRLPSSWRELTREERALPLYESAPDVQVLFRAALNQYQVGWMPRATWHHGRGTTTLGLKARLHRSVRWGRVQEAVGLPPEVTGSSNDYRVYSVRGEKRMASVYGSHLARLHARLALQADVQLTWRRYRVFDEAFFGTEFSVPYLFVNPRLGVTWNPERPYSAYASVALANREPRLKSLYDGEEAGAGALPQFEETPAGALDFDVPLVRPERLIDLELGARVLQPLWRLSANVYAMQFADEIVPSGGLDQFGVPRTGNAKRTRHRGLELEGQVRMTEQVDAFGALTISRSRFVSFIEYLTPEGVDRAGNPIALFPSRVASAGLTWSTGELQVRTTVQYTGTQYVDNGGGRDEAGRPQADHVVDPYRLVNASVRYGFGERSPLRGLALYADINNVLNSKVLLFGNAGFGAPQFFPAATRHAFIGARYTLR